MNATPRTLGQAVKHWIAMFGLPVLIIALLFAGTVETLREFFSPIPLAAAIHEDLDKSVAIQSLPHPAAEQRHSHGS